MLYVVFRYSEMGTVVIGKVESGRCNKGDTLLVMPNRVSIIYIIKNVKGVFHFVEPGQNLVIRSQ